LRRFLDMTTGNEKFDREFEAFLAEEDSRLAALYRNLPRPEPDAKLDAAVHGLAHRALNPQLVATSRSESSRRRSVRWLPALGTAAGIALAAGIAFQLAPSVRNDRNKDAAPASDVVSVRSVDAPALPAAPPLSPAPGAGTPAQGDVQSSASRSAMAKMQANEPTGTIEVKKPAPALKDLDRTATLADGAADAGGSGKAEQASAPQPQAFPAAAQARKRAPTNADAEEHRQIMAEGAWQNLHERDVAEKGAIEAQRVYPADDKSRAAAKMVAPAREKPTATSAASPLPSSTSDAETSSAAVSAPSAAAREQKYTDAQPKQGFAPPPAARAPATAPAAAGAAPVRERAPAAVTESERLHGEAVMRNDLDRAKAGVTADELKQKPSGVRSNDPNAKLYPEHWLTNIRTMLKKNHRDEAVRSLAEFRKMYPDYHLPDDLRNLK
jgi:hypothetical protein